MKWHHAINSQILWQGTFFNFVEICGDNMHIHFFRTICRKYSYGVKICVHIHTFFKNRCLYQTQYILDDVQQIKEHALKKKKLLLILLQICTFISSIEIQTAETSIPMSSYKSICHYFDFYLLLTSIGIFKVGSRFLFELYFVTLRVSS